MNITKICEYCKKEFTIPYKQRNKKYCNQKCYVASGIKGKGKQQDLYEIRQCLYCHNEFEIRKKQKNKLCSDKCRKAWNLLSENKLERIKKSKEVIIANYGVDSIFKTIEGQEKVKQSFISKYGVNHPMYVDSFVNKLKDTVKNKYIPIMLDKLKLNNLELLDEYTKNKNGATSIPYTFKCISCSNIFTSTLLGCGKIPICRKCYPLINNSVIEQKIKDLLNNHKITHSDNLKILNGKEIDVFISDKLIGVEINGNYYHSENHGKKNKNYHINKSKIANNKNIKLIHIFEDEIINNFGIVESNLKFMLGEIYNIIDGKECTIKEITKKETKKFLSENHLDGDCSDNIRYGLFYDNELITVMTFGVKYNKLSSNKKFMLLRFCNKINLDVINSFNILLNYFIKINSPNLIITYADIRWFGINPNKTIYYENGFKYIKNTSPNYWYLNISDFGTRIDKNYARKNIITDKKDIKNKTDWKIMQEKGYDRIWDCGYMKFEMNI